MATFSVKSKNNIINDMLIQIVENVDDITDVNVGAVLRQLVESLGIELSSLYDSLQTIYLGTRIDTATQTDLENLGALLGITRKQGTKSQGYITFMRKAPAIIDFTIPSGTIISTPPNTPEQQKRYVVLANTTFSAAITGETHKFINGIYNYKMNERFIDSIQNLTGTVTGAPYTFGSPGEYTLAKAYDGLIINPTSITMLDECDVITGWTSGTGAETIATDSADKKQGTASLKLGKVTTTSDTVSYNKTLGSVVDGSNKDAYLWIKVLDNPTKNKIKNLNITVGSGGGSANSFTFATDGSDLDTGWNVYKLEFLSTNTIKTGAPNRSAMNYLKFEIVTNNNSDTLSSGDLKMDFWTFGTSEDYYGDIVQFTGVTLPDPGTNFLTSYKPLSKEVLCESETVGIKFNVGKRKISFKISIVANIDSVNNYVLQSGATDLEIDDDLRVRVQNATELKGKATVEALRQAVLAVEGVTSVSIDDMPLKISTTELHNFVSFASTPIQKLSYEVAQDNPTLVLTGTRGGGGVTFTKNTDYFLQDTKINWITDPNAPDDGTNWFGTYDYRWLGHVNMFVAGTSTPLQTSVVTAIDDAIADTKAAGVVVTWAEPTLIVVDVTGAIKVKTSLGFSFTDVKQDVIDRLESFLNAKDVGVTLYIAELIDQIMSVDGVENVTISLPATDITVGVSEVVRSGTITITQI